MNAAFQLFDINGAVAHVDGPTAVTVGVFDGVHCGHRHLLKQLADESRRLGVSSCVVTLTAHPSYVLGRRPSEYWLDDPEEHLQLLFEAGMRYVAVMPFTAEVAHKTACQTARLLHDQLQMQSLLLGYDSRFGSKQDDDFDRLPQLADEMGFNYRHGEPYLLDGAPVSSSRIRNALLEGDVKTAAKLLDRSSYSIEGTVIHGRGVGRTLGFPTANIDLSLSRKMLPKEGVYTVSLETDFCEPTSCRGIANLGTAPTFGIEKPMLEVHLLDFDGDLYGHQVEVSFQHRLRDTVRFDSIEALEQQLQKDLNACRQL